MQNISSLYKSPLCDTLSKVLQISKNTCLTSTVGSQSNDELVSLTKDNHCETQVLTSKKPDWHMINSSFL